MLTQQITPFPQDLSQRPVQTSALLLLATKQCDAFAIFPDSRENVSVFGFGLIDTSPPPTEAATDDEHQSAGQNSVDHRRNHQKSGDRDRDAADAERQRTSDR